MFGLRLNGCFLRCFLDWGGFWCDGLDPARGAEVGDGGVDDGVEIVACRDCVVDKSAVKDCGNIVCWGGGRSLFDNGFVAIIRDSGPVGGVSVGGSIVNIDGKPPVV